ncbi:MAG: hypothetical protein ACJ8GN_06400 [Longimicrobiaceae bacterium]
MALTWRIALTLALQVAIGALTLGFGLLALRVAPRPGKSERTLAWFMAGVTFTFDGALALVHSLVCVAAAFVPQESSFFRGYLRFTPAANDARNLLVLGFAAGLGWVVLLRRPAPSARTIVAVAGVLALAGFVAGLAEPPFEQQRGAGHMGILSLGGAATSVILFAALYRGMVRETIDWLLWIALALYAADQALSSNIQTALAWAGFDGAWRPSFRSMMWVGLVSASVMLACSVRRLAIARAGEEAPGLLERLRG